MEKKPGNGPAQQGGADWKEYGLGLSGLLPGIWRCFSRVGCCCMAALIRCLFGPAAVLDEDSLAFETVSSGDWGPPLSLSYGLATDRDWNRWLLCIAMEPGDAVLSSILEDVSLLTARGVLHHPSVALITLGGSAFPEELEEFPGDGEFQIQIFRYADLKEDCSGEEVLPLAMLELLAVDEILARQPYAAGLRKAEDAASRTAGWIEEMEPEDGYPPGSLRVLEEEMLEALMEICGSCGDPDFGNRALDRLVKALPDRVEHLRISEDGPLSDDAGDPQQIFGESFRDIAALSDRTAVLLVNGLYGAGFDPDSSVIHWPAENIDFMDETEPADSIIEVWGLEQGTGVRIRGVFLIEFMTCFDCGQVLTTLDHIFHDCMRTVRTEENRLLLKYPDPRMFYLFSEEDAGDGAEVEVGPALWVEGRAEDCERYKIPNVQFLARSFEDNARDLLPLLPFEILRYWDEVGTTPPDQLLDKVRRHAERIRDALVDAGGPGGVLDDFEVSGLLDITRKLYLYAYRGLEDQTGEEMTVIQNAQVDLSPGGKLYRMHQQTVRERKGRAGEAKRRREAEARTRQLEAFIRENGLTPPPPGNCAPAAQDQG